MSKPNQMACAVLLILGLSGCGLWQATSDGATSAYQAMTDWRVKAVDVDMRARADLNPDASGHPHPVAVRVYQLKDRARFDSASFNELLHHDRSVLGRDLQASVSAVVNPGASASVSQPMQRRPRSSRLPRSIGTPIRRAAGSRSSRPGSSLTTRR